MVFSSIDFIFWFLPLFLVIYFLATESYKNAVLLLGSIVFYGIGEPVFVVLILISISLNYFAAIKIDSQHITWIRRFWFILSLIYNIGTLVFFKYFVFIAENFNNISNIIGKEINIKPITVSVPNIILPIGISFYTFQIMSYVIDVYKRNCAAEKSYINLGTYICMFPQLVAGPIILYSDIIHQIRKRYYNIDQVEKGVRIFVLGLSSKVLLADRIGILWHDVQTIGIESISTPLAWLGAFAFTFQIYFDFYGYSLMAKGLGQMLGFSIPNNFELPYMSRSVSEFWRRWHITLGIWFREYIYIPLGGNRNGSFKTIRNLFFVWLLTGLWHGASWNFLIWGLFIYSLIIIEKFGLRKILDMSKIISHTYMILIIPVTWILFGITSPSDIVLYLSRMFPVFSQDSTIFFSFSDCIEYLKTYGFLFMLCIVFSTSLPRLLYKRIILKRFTVILLLALFWISIYFLHTAENNPFLYFRF